MGDTKQKLLCHQYIRIRTIQYNRLHAKYVAGILKEATIRLKRLPNLNQASTAISKQVTICGDLHGKLDDLLVVFHKVSKYTTYLFIYRCNVSRDPLPIL